MLALLAKRDPTVGVGLRRSKKLREEEEKKMMVVKKMERALIALANQT